MRRFALSALAASVIGLAPPVSRAADARSEVILLYDLLHLDKAALDPSLADPLTEMQAVQNAYVELREHAKTDTSPDTRFLKLFLFAGWAARQTNAFGTIEAFNTDLKPIFDQEPQAVLGILKSSDFLLDNSCATLGRHFFFEDAQPVDRYAFMRGHEGAIRDVLGEEGAAKCAAAFWSVTN